MAVKGAGVTIFSGGVALAIQVVATVVLSRQLTPRDFGLVVMVTTFSALLENFGSNGIVDAVVQASDIDHDQASTLFWIYLGGGLFLSLGFAAAGSLIAKFYGEPAVAPISAGIAATIFLSSMSGMHLGLLRRAMRFSAVSFNNIVARVVSVTVSICFAWAGFGYWALVLGTCALSLSTAVGAWYLCRWTPGKPRSAPGTRSMLHFAMYSYGRFTVNYFARNADNLLVGWRFGAHALGFYKKAFDLFALSATQLVSLTTSVAVSALSRVRDNRAEFHRNLLGAMTVMAFLGMGLSGDLTLVGKDLIRVLLGPRWEAAGQIFTFFAPGIGMMILYGTHGWIHLSIGRADRWFRWGMVEWSVTILLFIAGLHWGPEGIAVAWCVSFWILTLPAMWYAGKPIGLSVAPVVNAVWKYIAASLAAGLLSRLIASKLVSLSAATGAGGAALRIAVVSVLFGCLYLGAIVVLHRGFSPLKKMYRLLREMVSVAGPGLTSSASATESDERNGSL